MNVIICDDHPLVAEGIGLMVKGLGEDVQVTLTHAAEDALSRLQPAHDFDLLLLDWFMPGMGGQQVIESLSRQHIELPILVVSASRDAEHVRLARAIGAMGFVSKAQSAASLLTCVRKVLAGELCFDEDALGLASVPRSPTLTPRQRQVLRALSRGLSNREIGDELFISEATVKSHLGHIFIALGVSSRVQAVLSARALGLLEAPG